MIVRLAFTAALLSLLTASGFSEEPPSDGFIITADSVEGTDGPRGRVVRLERNVTIRRGDATLVGERGIYYESEGLAIVFGNVNGVDRGSSIACDTLRYFREPDRALLVGNASYGDTSGVTTADVIDVYRREKIAVCTGNAVASDHDGSSKLRAGRIIYDFERDEARASVDPVLRTFGDDGEDEGTLSASVMEFLTAENRVDAFGDVRIATGEVSAAARMAVLRREDDSIELTGDPSVDQDGDVLTGDRIIVFASDGELSRVMSTGHARAAYSLEAEEGEEAQHGHVGGDTLTMYFENDEPVRTTVRGDAQSEHFVGAVGEQNTVSSREVDVIFVDGRIQRVVFRGSASGTYVFPPEEPEGEPADSVSAALDSVAYRADRIDYYVARNRIVLTGTSVVGYQDTVLLADDIEYDPDAQVLSAYGSPDLREKSERLAGHALAYDLSEQSGVVADGVTTFEDGLYSGQKIARSADGTLMVQRGVYTTCADDPPHYRLVSHRMKVYLDDKVIARPVILYIGEIPLFALPFYVFPIRKDRHSGFLIPQIELGITESGGRFVRNFGYYWAPNDYTDVTLWGDYYEQTKWIGHAEVRYKLRYVLSGSVNASFMEEMLNNRRRWDLKLSHRQEFGRNWTAGASGDFRSDATYASDTFQTIEESVNRSLHSQLWLRGRWSGLSAGVTLDRREQIDQDRISELLPKIDVTASQRPLASADEGSSLISKLLSRVSYSWDARAVNDRDRKGDELDVRQAAGVGLTLRASGKLLGWLNVSPRASARQNWYDRDREGRKFPTRLTYDAGLSAGTTLYGTFFPGLGPLDGLRHIVESSASFGWTPEFPDYFRADGTDLFYSLAGFGSTPRPRKTVNLSLVNKLQVRLAQGDGYRKIDNLARLSMSTSYDFEADGHPWGGLLSGLEVRPDRALTVRWNTRHDTRDGSLESSNVTATMRLAGTETPVYDVPWEDRSVGQGRSPVAELRSEFARQAAADRPGGRPWDVSATFRYSRGANPDNKSYWADGRAALSLTRNWRLNYSIHYDIKEGEVASQEYTIYRDLHCWEAQFTRRYYEGEWQYYFRVSVKALPEIQAEAGRKHLKKSVR